jgi:type I restriction enzyme S subunit
VYSSSRRGLIPQSDYYDQREAAETNLGYKVVPHGYVTYRHMSDDDVFHFNINNTGGEILVSSEYPVFTASSKGQLGFLIPALNGTARFRYFCKTQKLGGTRTRLYLENLKKYSLALAPRDEQDKIAVILATQDKQIELKEKLLEEKQRQKKYLMQQLLTGKKRLPGFDGEWKKTKLKKLLKERKTFSPKGAEYPHVTLSTEGIYAKSERYDRDHLVKNDDKEYKITHKGDICYNPANLKFGVICINDFGYAIFSPIYVTFEVVGKVCPEFLASYLMRWDFINAVRKYEEGTVYERMAVKPEDFLKFEMMLPPYEEQVAIAEIISTADKEMELLRQDLEQEKQKKKALMQLLLTGIVRVRG